MLPLQVLEDGGACFVILQIFSGDLDVSWLDCVCLGGLLLVAVLLEIFELCVLLGHFNFELGVRVLQLVLGLLQLIFVKLQ